ncbi:MAG TPA: SHOCT domain-containing protein [bacterium]|nr:SHOCT domain-containing protein [bacterium]
MRRGSGYAFYGLLAVGIVLAALAAAAAPGLAQVRMPIHPGGPGFTYPGGGGFRFFWIAGLFALLRVALIVSVLVLIWKAIGARTLWARPDAATQVLRERYARGEITDDEYHKRLATLG